MSEIRENLKGTSTNIIDADTGQELLVEYAVDITDECGEGTHVPKAMLIYATAQRGPIVQLRFGGGCYFFMSDLNKSSFEALLKSRARMLGIPAETLLRMIRHHATDHANSHPTSEGEPHALAQ